MFPDISLHLFTFLYISLHFFTFLYISLHSFKFLYISLHFSIFLDISLHFFVYLYILCVFSSNEAISCRSLSANIFPQTSCMQVVSRALYISQYFFIFLYFSVRVLKQRGHILPVSFRKSAALYLCIFTFIHVYIYIYIYIYMIHMYNYTCIYIMHCIHILHICHRYIYIYIQPITLGQLCESIETNAQKHRVKA